MPDVRRDYWRRNLTYLGVLLGLWFVVSYGCGVLFVDALDELSLGGFPLGFWFAQQGSIYTFVLLIFTYVVLMNRLEAVVERGDGLPPLSYGFAVVWLIVAVVAKRIGSAISESIARPPSSGMELQRAAYIDNASTVVAVIFGLAGGVLIALAVRSRSRAEVTN